MANLISVIERNVTAKGLHNSQKINREKIKDYFFDQEYSNLSLLNQIEKIPFLKENITVLYPGCGFDILTPLLYLEKLISKPKKITFIFVDTHNNLSLIKTILDTLNVSFNEQREKAVSFYWNNILIHLKFIQMDIFSIFDTIPLFDIYFEKAFRIMKENYPHYEFKIVHKLNKNGILISDSGFQNLNLKIIPCPQELSAYKEMIIGIKK